jgi:hypothetical protein
VRAHNDYGWGDFSSTGVFIASDIPDTPAAVTTSIVNMYVRISWVVPNDNYQSVDAY